MLRVLSVLAQIATIVGVLLGVSTWYADRECRSSGKYCQVVVQAARVVPFLDGMSAEAGVCLSEQARAAALAAPGRRHVVGCVTSTPGTGPSHARFTAGMADGENVAAFDQFYCFSPDWTQIVRDLAAGTLVVACNWTAQGERTFSVVRVYQSDRLDAANGVVECACQELFLSNLAFDAQSRTLSADLKTDAGEIDFEGSGIKVALNRSGTGVSFYRLSIVFGPSGPASATAVLRGS